MATEVTEDGQVIVSLPGEIDISNVKEFIALLDDAAAKSPDGFIIDLSETTYIDSAGVQAILAAYAKEHAEHRKLAVVIGNPLIRSVLGVVHLEQLPGVLVFDDLQAAKQAIAT
ncbi:MAG TPA: STAS domain-containing protein [Armatimonadota bacterium]|nr:STAS domain-containing protein [Armatimonadota bacterium]